MRGGPFRWGKTILVTKDISGHYIFNLRSLPFQSTFYYIISRTFGDEPYIFMLTIFTYSNLGLVVFE